MKRLRATFALLFHVLLLQATVLGGGMACAPEWLGVVALSARDVAPAADRHEDADAPASRDAHGAHVAHASHGAQSAASDATHDAHDARPPAHAPEHGGASTHCATATGCAAVAVAAPELTTVNIAVIDGAVRGEPVTAPPSTRQAPEPPPPRV